MQLSSDILERVTYLVGSADIAVQLPSVSALVPFQECIVDYLNDVSKILMKDPQSKAYSDVITFAFWIRKASVQKLKKRFGDREGIPIGRGVAFHISPSNVPVNFAYSLAAGLLTGNANVVRVPSKEFPQVRMITDAFNKALGRYDRIRSYVLCIRYGHDKEVNDLFSSIADIRIVWGGDRTIAEFRRSPMPPRSEEITFADRYSLAVIDSDVYLKIEDKVGVAEDFYNDTFFSDQNACTSPRAVVWVGGQLSKAKRVFWDEMHRLVKKKYVFQPIQSVNKLCQSYLIAAAQPGVKVEEHVDNLIIRVSVPEITDYLMDYRDNSGYFYEYDCKDVMELMPLCNDKRCQTIAYIGDKESVMPLLRAGAKGIDRVVPMGKTMDFDLIWDGFDLPTYLSRTVVMK